MKMKLLETKIIKGVYIERSKNLSKSYYNITANKESIIFTRKIN
jgi:hypothetical protein